jgi:hypothetical protein
MEFRTMALWLRPLKLREHYVDHRFDDIAEANRQLYLAVIRGDVRARLKGRLLGPEWRRQLASMKTDDSFELPPDLELSVEDAERIWS